MVTLQFDDIGQVAERTSNSLRVVQFSPQHQAFFEQGARDCQVTAGPSVDRKRVQGDGDALRVSQLTRNVEVSFMSSSAES